MTPDLKGLRQVGMDAWLEAGGCPLCWGTHLVIIKTTELDDTTRDAITRFPRAVPIIVKNEQYVLRCGFRCKCSREYRNSDEVADGIGVSPWLPPQFAAAVDIALEMAAERIPSNELAGLTRTGLTAQLIADLANQR